MCKDKKWLNEDEDPCCPSFQISIDETLRTSVFSFGFFTKSELMLMIDCFYKNENLCP